MALKFGKFNYFRSKRHLMNVASLPCQMCGAEGMTQAAHANWARYGKGRGIKASDEYTAALCQDCHYILDQHPALSKLERQNMWEFAWRKTVRELVAQDLWPSEIEVPNVEDA